MESYRRYGYFGFLISTDSRMRTVHTCTTYQLCISQFMWIRSLSVAQQGPWLGIYYDLNICLWPFTPPCPWPDLTIHMLEVLTSKDDDIRKWGLWEVLRSWEWSPCEWLVPYIKMIQRGLCPFHHVRTERESAGYEPVRGLSPGVPHLIFWSWTSHLIMDFPLL